MAPSAAFRAAITEYYEASGRDLPWRRTRNPYRILVSEIMLQQTQVERVQTFYEKFIKRFPDFFVLAKSKKSDVLRMWQGLGYNRRALALREIAKIVVKKYSGKLPRKREALESLPGVGPYTAGAVRAFAFNKPGIFVETNIRRIFIHFFFTGRRNVHDREILPIIEKTLDRENPREWYFSLMDYGAMLGAKTKANPNRRSAHYAKQSKFSGSDREIRGKILRFMLNRKRVRMENLEQIIPQPKERIVKIVTALSREGFLRKTKNTVSL